jgi:hypothetical protein
MEEKLFNPVKMLELPTPVKYSSNDYIRASMRKEIKENNKLRGKANTGLFK